MYAAPQGRVTEKPAVSVCPDAPRVSFSPCCDHIKSRFPVRQPVRSQGLNFVAATSRLLSLGFTLEQIAEEAGTSRAAIKAARLSGDSESHRSPPPNWETAIAQLARRRSRELQRLAKELDS